MVKQNICTRTNKGKLPVEFYTLSRVLFELQGLVRVTKIRKEVGLIEQIIKINNIKIIESKINSVDDELVELSKNYVIATNDKELRKK